MHLQLRDLFWRELSDEVAHLSGEDEGLHVSLEAKLLLEVPKEMSKVDVKEPAGIFLKHVITCMSIADP